MEPLDKIFTVICIVMGIFAILLMFIWLPISLYSDAECLRAGYPNSHITFNLEQYCTTVDSAVALKTVKQTKE